MQSTIAGQGLGLGGGAASYARRNCYERTLQDAGSTPCAGIVEARQVPAGVCPPVGREWPVGERTHPSKGPDQAPGDEMTLPKATCWTLAVTLSEVFAFESPSLNRPIDDGPGRADFRRTLARPPLAYWTAVG